MKRVAVIGVTGLLGIHTAREVIRRGHGLIGIYRDGSKLHRLSGLDFEPRMADLNDAASLGAALKQADGVIHCAGYTPALPRPLKDEIKTASLQMEHVCAACAHAGVNKIVYISAGSSLRDNPSGGPGSEEYIYERAPSTKNPFVQVKWHMDSVAMDHASRGLPLVAAIPGMSFGEYDYGPTAGRLIVNIASGALSKYVRARRNVIYAGDTARGALLCLEKGTPGKRYVLTGENMTMTALTALIAEKAGVPAPAPVPKAAALAYARLQLIKYKLGGAAPAVTPAAVKVLAGGRFYDGSRAERELGFRASTAASEAVERALHWFKKNGYINENKRQIT